MGYDVGTKLVEISGSSIQQPTDVQNRYQKSFLTHNAVSVAAASWSVESAWRSCKGFDKIAATLKVTTANAGNKVNIQWSHDGTNQHGEDTLIPANNTLMMAGIIDTKADYYKIATYNGNAAADTQTAYAYQKV